MAFASHITGRLLRVQPHQRISDGFAPWALPFTFSMAVTTAVDWTLSY